MSPPKSDALTGASGVSVRRKAGRPFKTPGDKPPAPDAAIPAPLRFQPAAGCFPPVAPYRSFKVVLTAFKHEGGPPALLDRSAFMNKLSNTNVREIVEAYRFLGLMDPDQTPTADLALLVSTIGEASWPIAVRGALERSYHHLLAQDPTMVTDSLHRSFRQVYISGSEHTRRRCNFFLHACRDAAGNVPGDAVTSELGGRLEPYNTAWPDDAKQRWFKAFHQLVQQGTRQAD